MEHLSRRRCPDRGDLGSERAAAAVELALVVWVFAAFFYAIVAFGSALALKQSITNAVSEGARAAVGVLGADQTETETLQEQAARDKVAESLDWIGSKYDGSELTVSIAECSFDATANCITVRLDHDYAERPIVPSAPGLSVVLPDTLSSEAVVQVPKY